MPTVIKPNIDHSGFQLSAQKQWILVRDAEAKELILKDYLHAFRGEWYLNLALGLPLYQSILIDNPDVPTIMAVMRDYVVSSVDFVRSARVEIIDIVDRPDGTVGHIYKLTAFDEDAEPVESSATYGV